jgi:hypothetical protein
VEKRAEREMRARRRQGTGTAVDGPRGPHPVSTTPVADLAVEGAKIHELPLLAVHWNLDCMRRTSKMIEFVGFFLSSKAELLFCESEQEAHIAQRAAQNDSVSKESGPRKP